MVIRCWGARGSVPVSGREYVKYGGDSTCLEIRTSDDDVIIVDAGTGIRRLGAELLREGRKEYSLIFTHAHWDHIWGFPFFKPIYLRGTRIAIVGCPFAQKSVRKMISPTMAPPNFPVNFDDVAAEISYRTDCQSKFSIGSMTVTPILLSHPNRGLGYRFEENGTSFVFLTDNELMFRHPGGLDYEDYLAFSSNADLLIHDAEFTDEEYKRTKAWGHSVYTDALRLALEAKVKAFGLFHHNQERDDATLNGMVQTCKEISRAKAPTLKCFAVRQGMEMRL